MGSLKALRTRIESVKNTKKITSTMKMVAAAKLRRSRIACEEARPFAESIAETVHGLASNLDKENSNILLQGYKEVKAVKILVFGSDKGLCGGFNEQLLKAVRTHIEKLEQQNIEVKVITFGNKAYAGLKTKYSDRIEKSYSDFSKDANFNVFKQISEDLTSDFKDNKVQQIYVAYNKFVNILTQEAVINLLAPIEIEQSEDISTDVILEPTKEKVLETLLPRFVASIINQSFLESAASEQACRMTAMEGSTKNASDVIEKLSLVYNRQRQANITSELIEIISGAQALNN
ncbi:MAG: ATP synthase F1 subunit gamma [Alphaproteobacteria bacterium]|nr:ATP synthase F1 subunit gamma [Alphaproteobacteria bacterium]